VDTGLGWELHRRQVYLRRRVMGWMDQLSPGLTARLKALRSSARFAAGKLPSHD
jgi:hypothetical protein